MVFGAQPGISRASGSIDLAEEAGMDSSIMHTVASNEDKFGDGNSRAGWRVDGNASLGLRLGERFDADQVLEVVMDLVFEHVKADQGICSFDRR